jgi:hypothetical protein
MAEVLPPMTVAQLLVDLDNPHFTGYVRLRGRVDGDERDLGFATDLRRAR